MKATKVCNISAGHQLALAYDSPCCNCHGHNYRVAVTVETPELNEWGMICDFSLIKEAVYLFDHQMIEEVCLPSYNNQIFRTVYGNATAENMAEAIVNEVEDMLSSKDPRGNRHARVVRVEVGETGGNIVVWGS